MGKRKFKPGLVPTVAFLLVLPVLVSLGFWQLDRAAQKQAMQQDYDNKIAEAPVKLGATIIDREYMRYRRVTVTGEYDYAREFLLDNRVLDRRVGYHVITPIKVRNTNTLVLINRGWVLGNPDRSILPETPGPAGTVEVMGIAIVPHDKVFQLAEESAIAREWPKVWQTLNLKRFTSAVSEPVQPVVVLLDPDREAGGFVRNWKRLDTGIAVHQGYAFQWFSLAVALSAIFFLVNFRKTKNDEEEL